MGESGSHLGSGGKRWILWPKSTPIPEFQGFLSIHSLGFDPHIPKGSVCPVSIRRGGSALPLGFSQFSVRDLGMGLNFGGSKGLPDPSRFHFSPSSLHTWKQSRDESRIFREFRLFSLASGKRQENGEFSSLGPFFGKLQQDRSSSRVTFPREFPL